MKFRLLILFSGLVFLEPLAYYFHLLEGNLLLLFRAKPLSEMEAHGPSLLREIPDILNFTKNELGLDPGNAYQNYLAHDAPLIYVVSGSKPFSLEALKWNYPILGSLGYKGFFSLAEAERTANLWKEKGYAVAIRPVNAWSTLGVLPDPVTSSMLKHGKGHLCEVLIHEISHQHLYIPNHDVLNENLAQHIGKKGALLYLKRHGEPEILEEYVHLLRKEDFRQRFLQILVVKTQAFYAVLAGTSCSFAQKREFRRLWFTFWADKSAPFFPNKPFSWLLRPEEANAHLVVFEQYNQKSTQFSQEFEQVYQGDIGLQVQSFLQRYGP